MKTELLSWLHELMASEPTEDWASWFVENRMELQRRFLRGIVLTTEHGADIFKNLLRHAQGEPYVDEHGEPGADKGYHQFLRKLTP